MSRSERVALAAVRAGEGPLLGPQDIELGAAEERVGRGDGKVLQDHA